MFVSRAGQKLEYALDEFKLDVAGLVCADLGCSTGGFTDCLLQRGAAKVYAVDTGYGVLDWKLRKDPRVVVMERTNAMHVVLPESMDFISIDVSWTPQRLVLPHAMTLIKPGGDIVSLIKPHYEAKNPRISVEEGETLANEIRQFLTGLGLLVKGLVKSPILGEKGKNEEYLIWVCSG